jgi:hypothetical protein
MPRLCSCAAQQATGRHLCNSCEADRSARLTLLRQARYRAKKHGLPFNLRLEDIHIPVKCPLLGIPLIPKRGAGIGPWKWSPSLDRVIPSGGYVVGNVQVISARANVLKRDSSLAELIAIGRWAERCTTTTRLLC